jgi:hypothetical protein
VAAPVALLVCAGVAGCGSPREEARQAAVAAVREKARDVRSQVAQAARGTSGQQQVEAVRTALPDVPLTARAGGGGVRVTGALTARGEAGGGLSYESFVARLCLTLDVAPQTGDTTLTDTPCTRQDETDAPADATVRLRN